MSTGVGENFLYLSDVFSVSQSSSHERENQSRSVDREYTLGDLHYLEVAYNSAPYPTPEQLSHIAEELRVPVSKVRVGIHLTLPLVGWAEEDVLCMVS